MMSPGALPGLKMWYLPLVKNYREATPGAG
jgi:hypothetical protein